MSRQKYLVTGRVRFEGSTKINTSVFAECEAEAIERAGVEVLDFCDIDTSELKATLAPMDRIMRDRREPKLFE